MERGVCDRRRAGMRARLRGSCASASRSPFPTPMSRDHDGVIQAHGAWRPRGPTARRVRKGGPRRSALPRGAAVVEGRHCRGRPARARPRPKRTPQFIPHFSSCIPPERRDEHAAPSLRSAPASGASFGVGRSSANTSATPASRPTCAAGSATLGLTVVRGFPSPSVTARLPATATEHVVSTARRVSYRGNGNAMLNTNLRPQRDTSCIARRKPAGKPPIGPLPFPPPSHPWREPPLPSAVCRTRSTRSGP